MFNYAYLIVTQCGAERGNWKSFYIFTVHVVSTVILKTSEAPTSFLVCGSHLSLKMIL